MAHVIRNPVANCGIEIIHDGATSIVEVTINGRRMELYLTREQLKELAVFLLQRADEPV